MIQFLSREVNEAKAIQLSQVYFLFTMRKSIKISTILFEYPTSHFLPHQIANFFINYAHSKLGTR